VPCLRLWQVSLLLFVLAPCPVGLAAEGHGSQTLIQRPSDALNPQLTNIIEHNTITLYYNGSGDVPKDGDPSPEPKPISPLSDASLVEDAIFDELVATLNGSSLDQCAKCVMSVQIFHLAAIAQPVQGIKRLLGRICKLFPSWSG